MRYDRNDGGAGRMRQTQNWDRWVVTIVMDVELRGFVNLMQIFEYVNIPFGMQ